MIPPDIDPMADTDPAPAMLDHESSGRMFHDRCEAPPDDLVRDTDGWLTLATVEQIAAIDDATWEIHIDGPTFSERFRREGAARWVCFEAGEGFA